VFLLVRSGLLVGATTIGTLATYAGQDFAMESSAAALVLFAAAYGVNNIRSGFGR